MSAWLVGSGLLMGLAASPHCLAMCGAACAAVVGPGVGAREARGAGRLRSMLAWQSGRALSYALAGAAAAGSVSLLAAWGAGLPWLRPWWLLLQLAALALGAWMLLAGRTPIWLSRPILDPVPATATPRRVVWLRSGGAGLAWAAWPCGLLHAALFTAALASSPGGGALVMVAFALGSGPALWAGPSAWRWLLAGRTAALAPSAAVRGAGALLAAGAGWSVAHGVLVPWIDALCR